MPIYESNGKRYSIPEEKINDFLKAKKDAKLVDETPFYLSKQQPKGITTNNPAEKQLVPPQAPVQQQEESQESIIDRPNLFSNTLAKQGNAFDKVKGGVSLPDTGKVGHIGLPRNQRVSEVMRDTYQDYKGDEQFKNSITTQLDAFKNENQSKLEGRYKDLQAREQEYERGKTGFQKLVTSGSARTSDRALTQLDEDYSNYKFANDYVSEAEQLIGNVKEEKGILKGVGDAVFDYDTWILGIEGTRKNAYTDTAIQKLERGEELTDSENALLDAMALNLAVNAYHGSDLKRQYNWGQIAGESLPFMMEFILNPFAQMGKGVGKAIAKHGIKRFGKKGAGALATRVGGSLASDVAGAGAMVGTTGLPRTFGDAARRHSGDAYYDVDDEGKIVFGGTENSTDPLESIGKAFLSQGIEYFSEMTGERFSEVGRLIGRSPALKRISATGIGRAMSKFNRSPVVRELKELEKRGQWSGLIGEWYEERVGTALNAILVGDSKISDLYDLEQQVDTFMGLSLTGGLMGGIRTTGYAADRAQSANKLRRTDRTASSLFPNWDNMKSQIEEMTLAERQASILDIAISKDIPDSAKAAYTDYVGAKNYQDVLSGVKEESNQEELIDTQQRIDQLINTAVNPETNSIIIANVPSAKEIRIYGNIILNEDGSINEKESKEIYYTDADGKRHVVSPKFVEIIENTPADMAKQEMADILNTEVVNRQANQAVRPYESGEMLTFSIDGQTSLLGQINSINEDGTYQIAVDGMPALVAIEPRMIVPEDNIRGIENGMQVKYRDQENNIQTGTVNDAFGLRMQGLIDVDGNMVPTTDIIPIDEMTDIEAENEASPIAEADNMQAEAEETEQNDTIPEQEAEIQAQLQAEQEKQAFMDSLPVYDKGKNQGEIDQSRMTPEQNVQYFEYTYGKEKALQAAEKQVANLKKRLKTEQTKLDNDPFNIQQNQKVEDVQTQLDVYSNYVNQEKQRLTEENIKRTPKSSVAEDRQARSEDIKQDEAGRTGEVDQSIIDKWNSAEKIEGIEDVITLANGEKIEGRYMLVVADAPSPSHDIERNFAKTVGFPVNEQGKTVNDRDYEADQTAQVLVQQRANKYDERAVQTPVVVSNDGIVLSGNDRTMAGQIAARNGTDGAYTDYIGRFADRWGFTPEQVQAMPNPRVVFVPNNHLPYNTATFAKFNAEEKKTQNSLETAIKASKSISREVVIPMAQSIEGFEKLTDFYNNAQAVKKTIDTLLQNGVIQSNELPRLMDGALLSAEGKSFLETVMLGSVLGEQALREVDQMRSVRQTLMRTMPQLFRNSSLNEYSLMNELNNAIHLLYEAKQSNSAVRLHLRQGNLFDLTAEEVYNETEKILSLALEGEKDTVVRSMFESYNKEATDIEAGQLDIFSGKLTRADLLKQILKRYGQEEEIGNKQEQPSAEITEQSDRGGQGERSAEQPEAGQQQSIDIVEHATNVVKSEEIRVEADKVDTKPSEAQKEAGNYRKGHINIQGFDITIENPAGSIRSGVNGKGKKWSNTMQNHYGYFKRTEGKDGDQIDVFVGDKPQSKSIFVVDQVNPETREFDESKVMLGFNTIQDAQQSYLSNYEEGWEGLESITEIDLDSFKKWLYDGAKQRKPFSEYKENQAESVLSAVENKSQDAIDIVGLSNEVTRKEKALTDEITSLLNVLNDGRKGKNIFDTANVYKVDNLRLVESVNGQEERYYNVFDDEGRLPDKAGSNPSNIKIAVQELSDITGKSVQEIQDILTPQMLFTREQEAKEAEQTPAKKTTAKRPTKVKAEKKPTEATPNEYGADNKLISTEQYEDLKNKMKGLLNNLNVGFNPEVFSIGAQMAAYHMEAGARKFADYATRMINDLGDSVKPYLKSFYEGVRAMGNEYEGMDSYKYVKEFDIDNFNTQIQENKTDKQVESQKDNVPLSNKQPQQGSLFDSLNKNEDGRQKQEDTGTDNRKPEPDRRELSESKQVGGQRVSSANTARTRKSKQGQSKSSSSEPRERSEYDLNKKYSNEDIHDIVSTVTEIKDGKVEITGEITDEIATIAGRYQSGGVAKEGRGVLDEYYTNEKIVDAVNEILSKYIKPNTNIRALEPSVGIGNFIDALPSINGEIVTFEINETTARIAKILHPNIEVNLRPFETEFIDEKGNKKPMPAKYDLIVGNPPYGQHRGKYKGLGEETKISRYEDYFVKRGLDVLNEKGILAMVLPSGWMNRHKLEDGYRILDAYRLPTGVFEGTGIGTDIVILQKESGYKATGNHNYFENNPANILGETKERKNRFGKMEEYVDGDIDNAMDALRQIEAKKIATDLKIEATQDNVNEIDEAIKETATTEGAKEVVKATRAKKSTATAPESGKIVITPNNLKYEFKKGDEVAAAANQFQNEFNKEETEAFKDTDYSGVLKNPKKHPKHANYYAGKWIHDFYYAEGNIYDRLEQLERDKDNISEEQYNKQRKMLQDVLPTQKSLSEINMNPNTAFVKNLTLPSSDTERTSLQDRFLDFAEKLPGDAFGSSNFWEVRAYVNNEQVYGQDKARNQLVRERRKRVGKDLFDKFLNEALTDTQKKQVEHAFNREYNAVYRPDYSKVPMFSSIHKNFRGEPFELTEVQKAGIGRMTVKGVGVLAHEVGFGKTLSAILSMHEAMERGYTRRPLIVVPNDSILKQWVETINDILPEATVNILGNLGVKYNLDNFSVNDGEYTIVTYQGFKKLSFENEVYVKLAQEFHYISDADLNKQKSERDIEKEKADIDETAGKMQREGSYSFEDAGFDYLTFDEVHNANHIVGKVQIDRAEYSDFRGQSQNTSDLGVKTWVASQYIQQQNDGRNVLLLSATPFTNKPLEYYSILSLVANSTLKRMGFYQIDQFFETFMEADNDLEISASGKPQQKTNVRRFRNNGLFNQLLGEYVDFKGENDNPDLVRPKRLNKEYKIPQNELTKQAQAQAQTLLEDGETVLSGLTQSRLIAFSPYASYLTNESPKSYKEFVENSSKIYGTIKLIEQNKKDNKNAGQIIYSELGVEYFPYIRDYLVNESKFKANEVAIIAGSTSANERSRIQNAFNKGTIKVVLGSPAIKEGMNLQENTSDMYILSLPYNFTQLRQVEGRGWRQGNKWRNIRVNYMLTNDSVDVFMLQRLQIKQGLYNEAMKQGAETIDVSDINTEELKNALITNPETRADLEVTVEKKRLEAEKERINADLAFILRKYEKFNKIRAKLQEKRELVQSYLERAERLGDSWWSQYAKSEQVNLDRLESDLQNEKLNLERKGVNIDDINNQIEKSNLQLQDLDKQIEGLKDVYTELVSKYRNEREEQDKDSGNLLEKHIHERASENKEGFFTKRSDANARLSMENDIFAEEEINLAYGSKEKQAEAIARTVREAETNITRDGGLSDNMRRLDRRTLPSQRTVLEGFKESGHVDFTGTKITNEADIADLWSIHRSPYIEKSHLIFVKDNVILGTLAVTSGKSNVVSNPNVEVIGEHAEKLGADGMYFLHNHPSGNPEVSLQDIRSTLAYKLALKNDYNLNVLGQVVIDHDKYSFIPTENTEIPDKLNESTLTQYKQRYIFPREYKGGAKQKLFTERESIVSRNPTITPQDKLFEIAKDILSEPQYTGAIVYLAPNLEITAYDIFPDNASIEDIKRIAKANLGNNIGSNVAFIHNGDARYTKDWGDVPYGTIDVINMQYSDGRRVYSHNYNVENREDIETRDLWEELQKPTYTGGSIVDYANQIANLSEEQQTEYSGRTPINVSEAAEQANSGMTEQLRQEYDRKYSRFATRFREAWEDMYLPVKQFLDVLRENGVKVEEYNDFYKQATTLSGKNDAQLDYFRKAFQKPITEQISNLEKLGFEYRDIENYVFAKHGLERNDHMAKEEAKQDFAKARATATDQLENGIISTKVYDTKIEEIDQREEERYKQLLNKDYSGLTELTQELEQTAEEHIAQFEEKAGEEAVNDLWGAIKKATNYSLERQYKSGVINKETLDEIKSMYNNYVPLRGHDAVTAEDRWDYTPDMGTYFTAPLMKSKGRRTRAESPFAYIEQMAHSAITWGNKNELKQTMLRLARTDTKGLMSASQSWYRNMGTEENPRWEHVNAEYSEDVDQYLKNQRDFEEQMQELKVDGMAFQGSTRRLNIGGLFIKPKQAEQHEIHIYQNGVKYTVYINANPAVARAINGSNKKDVSKSLGAFSNVTRNMAANFTTRNPLFVMTNLSRDYIFASSILTVKESPVYAVKFQRNIPNAIGSLQRYIRGKLDLTNPTDAMMHEYIMNGAKTGFSSIFELDRVAKKLKREAEKGNQKKSLKDAGRSILDVVDGLNEMAENISRFSVYMTSRNEGRSIAQSVHDAKNVTVNFNQKGAGTSVAKNPLEAFLFNSAAFVRPLYLFTNAAIQSLSNITKVAIKNPKGVAKLISFYTISGFISPLLNALIGGDDAEDEYMKLTDWERHNNWCISLPNGFIKIPLPHELRVFHRMGDNIYQAVFKNKDIFQTLLDTAMSFSDLLPINPLGSTDASWAELIPDAIRPFAQLATNTNFMGSRIYDQWASKEEPGYKKVRTNKKGEPYAPQFMISAAKSIDNATGGDGVKKGIVSPPNPDIVNHLMRGYFGGLYTLSEQGVSIIAKTHNWAKSGDFELKVRETPLRTFYADKNDLNIQGSGLNTKYYDVSDKISENRRRIKGYSEQLVNGEITNDVFQNKIKDLNIPLVNEMNEYIKIIKKYEGALKDMNKDEQKDAEKIISDLKKTVIELGNGI